MGLYEQSSSTGMRLSTVSIAVMTPLVPIRTDQTGGHSTARIVSPHSSMRSSPFRLGIEVVSLARIHEGLLRPRVGRAPKQPRCPIPPLTATLLLHSLALANTD